MMIVSVRSSKELIYNMAFGILLTMAGGFMDVYSYLVHGKVFATGQTGNFVLLGVYLIEGNYGQMLHALVPILSFWLGVFTATHLFYCFQKKPDLLKPVIILTEIVVLLLTGFLPASLPDILPNILVSFAASLQFCAFRTFGMGESYSSVFCTGNMRSCAENYYKGFIRKEKQCFQKAAGYSFILLSFFIGVSAGAFLSKFFGERAILWVNLLLLAVLILPFIPVDRMLRLTTGSSVRLP